MRFSKSSIRTWRRSINYVKKRSGSNTIHEKVALKCLDEIERLQARVVELDKQTEAVGDLLESISMWLWKIQGLQPEPMWVDQFKSVCNLFEPPQQPESEEE